LTDRLADLVRRELVFLDADPRSPERGQYSFVQPLIREVAYARLGLRERRARHLEVARFMESLDDPEIAGAVANHYLAAYQAGSSGDESSDLAASALAALITAADRAASLHSHRQAFFYLEQALTVAPDEPTRAGLWERAGAAALAINDQDLAEQHAQRALDSYRLCGDRPGLARAAVLLARHFFSAGRPEQGLDVLTAVVDEVGQGEDAATASLLAELARGNMLVLNYAGAAQVAEQALSVAEALELEPVVIEALNTRGTSLGSLGRHQEAVALLSHALRLADGTGNIQSAIRARNNLGYTLNPDDPKETYRYMREAMDLARRVGLRGAEVFHLRGAIDSALTMGDWEWILGVVEEARRRGFADSEVAELEAGGPIQIRAFRGDPAGAEEAAETDMRFLEDVTDPQALAWRSNMRGWLAMAAGRLADAGRHGLEALEMDPIIEHAAPALFAALLMRDQAKMIEMAAALDNLKIRGRVVGAMRTLARGALLHPSEEATGLLTGATRTFRDLDLHLYLGMSLACAAVLLAGRDPWAVEARVEAESVFDSLEASSLRRLLEDCLARPLIGTGAATSD
jgi:tetratricopeptide (TPR) repeat protein